MNPTSSADALSQLQNFQNTAQTPDQLLSTARQQNGVDQAQQTVSGLRGAIQNTSNLLKQVAPSVMGRTANSLVTNAQANAQINNESAPLNQTLNEQNTGLGNATQDYNTAEQKADEGANLAYEGQKDKTSYLQNIYDTLYKKEQDAASAALAQQQLDAQKRAAASAYSGTSAGSSAGGTATPAKGAGGTAIAPKAGGGYAFTGPNSQPISAAQYAAVNGIPFRTLLSQMASQGDTGAKAALGFVGNDFGYDPSKVNNQNLVNLYNSLVWGTGRSASVPSSNSLQGTGLGLAGATGSNYLQGTGRL